MQKNLVSFFSVLQKLKTSACDDIGHGAVKLIYLFAIIIFIALSKNALFISACGAADLVAIALLKAEKEKRIILSTLTAVAFSALILLPSIFMGNPKSLLTITLKVAVTVSAVSLFNETTSSQNLISSMKYFFVPDIIINVFLWTFKYIFILSQICSQMLSALNTRLIGKRIKGNKSYSGILSICFIKSKAMVAESNDAMECRGFDGKYIRKKTRLGIWDLIISLVFFALLAMFIFAEVKG